MRSRVCPPPLIHRKCTQCGIRLLHESINNLGCQQRVERNRQEPFATALCKRERAPLLFSPFFIHPSTLPFERANHTAGTLPNHHHPRASGVCCTCSKHSRCAVVTSAAKPPRPQHRRLAAGSVHSFLPPPPLPHSPLSGPPFVRSLKSSLLSSLCKTCHTLARVDRRRWQKCNNENNKNNNNKVHI